MDPVHGTQAQMLLFQDIGAQRQCPAGQRFGIKHTLPAKMMFCMLARLGLPFEKGIRQKRSSETYHVLLPFRR